MIASLHWLPVCLRTDFTYKAGLGLATDLMNDIPKNYRGHVLRCVELNMEHSSFLDISVNGFLK